LWTSVADVADDRSSPPPIDTSVAHSARVYDYWLGGKDNFPTDQEAGDLAIDAYPDTRSSVRANRAFLRRTVSYLAEAGIRQFLDIGTGLPSANNTHEVAQAIAPESRVVYVDNDPIVAAHAGALLASSPDGVTGYLDADARDTATIISEAARVLDFQQPVAVQMVALLHLIGDDDDPYGLVQEFLRAVPSGSYLVISHVASDMQKRAAGLTVAAARLTRLMVQQVRPRDQGEVTRFFDGLEILEPGVVPIQEWRPASDEEAAARAGLWGGVGRKP
jgi:hypothetical protein